MNGKGIGGFALLLLLLTGCGGARNPDVTIKRAYDWYVEMVKSAQNPWQRARVDLKPVATERFIDSLENERPDLEADGMLDRRNFDARLAIENVSINGGVASARVIVAGRLIGRQMLNVYLVRDGRTWKIDDVKLIDSE